MEKGSPSIPVAKPYFSGAEAQLVADVLKSGWIVQGPMVAKFEDQIAKYTGALCAVATSSCTTALHLAMLVNDIGTGDDVICPSYSFIATANGITYSRARPQFVDIDPSTWNIDPAATEAFIEATYDKDLRHKVTRNKLKAVLIVHQIGIPADIDAFDKICKRYGILLMEDSACGLGSKYKGKPIGSSGNVNTLSFHPRKVISCGEGGMVLTSDKALADKARVYRAHGASLSDFSRHQSGCTTYETYEVVGYNYRMTDIHAAIGFKQLEILDKLMEKRAQIARHFDEAFSKLDELEILTPPAYVSYWNHQSYPIRLRKGGRAERDALMQALESRGISSRRGIPPIHKEPVYDTGVTLPHSESVSDRSLLLPIFYELTNNDIERVITGVKQSLPMRVRA